MNFDIQYLNLCFCTIVPLEFLTGMAQIADGDEGSLVASSIGSMSR